MQLRQLYPGLFEEAVVIKTARAVDELADTFVTPASLETMTPDAHLRERLEMLDACGVLDGLTLAALGTQELFDWRDIQSYANLFRPDVFELMQELNKPIDIGHIDINDMCNGILSDDTRAAQINIAFALMVPYANPEVKKTAPDDIFDGNEGIMMLFIGSQMFKEMTRRLAQPENVARFPQAFLQKFLETSRKVADALTPVDDSDAVTLEMYRAEMVDHCDTLAGALLAAYPPPVPSRVKDDKFLQMQQKAKLRYRL